MPGYELSFVFFTCFNPVGGASGLYSFVGLTRFGVIPQVKAHYRQKLNVYVVIFVWNFSISESSSTVKVIISCWYFDCVYAVESTGIDDMITVTQQHRWRWYEHVLRKNENDWVNKCMDFEVKDVRPRGRPRKLGVRPQKKVVRPDSYARTMLSTIENGESYLYNSHKGRVWVSKCFFWLTWVNLDKGPLNVLLCCCYAQTWAVFGRLFVKQFALCYQTVVMSVLSCLLRWCIVAKRLDGSRWNLARS